MVRSCCHQSISIQICSSFCTFKLIYVRTYHLSSYICTYYRAVPFIVYTLWKIELSECLVCHLSGVYTSNLLNDLEFYLGQILSLYKAKSLGNHLAQIKFQIVKQIGCVDAALLTFYLELFSIKCTQ